MKAITRIILSLMCLMQIGFAQMVYAQKLQSHVLELQNRIEAQIDRNMINLISTQLKPTSFDVSTRVKVVEVPPVPPKPDKKKDPDQMPAGMELGSVDVREVIQAYKQEIEQLKAFKETDQKDKPESKYNISSIEIVVGLSELYDDAYVAQFQDWLSKRVRFDYGPNAKAVVNKTQPLPVKEPEPEKPKEVEPFNWRDLLPLLTYAFLGLSLIAAAWLLMRGLTKLGQGAKSIIVEHKNPFAVEHNQKVEMKEIAEVEEEQKNEDDENNLPEAPLAEEMVDEDLEQLQVGDSLIGKITYLCLELGKGVNELVRVWLDNGNDGYVKTAILIDMIVTLKEKVSAETAAANSLTHKEQYDQQTAQAISRLTIPMDEDLAASYGVNLSEAYREAASMDKEKKLDYLEKIYWDLLQVRTLGAHNMRKPFDYLQSMNDMAYSEVLKTQSDEGKALALMFGDPNKAKSFMSSISEDEKEKIVQNMLSMSSLSKKQILDMDANLKLQLINSSLNPSENLVNLFPRTIDMLNSLSPVDEIKVLRKVVATMPEGGTTLKQQFTTLAFIDQWNEEYIEKLVKVATSAELVQLIFLVPEAQDVVLNACPDKMKMIISDDLSMQTPDEQTIAKGVKQLKAKWKQICATEGIAMGNVINFDKQGWMKNVG